MNFSSTTITQEVDSPSPTKTGKVNSKGRVFESLFEAILTHYQGQFKLEETHRNTRFNTAERTRDFADLERSRLFYQHESTHSAEFAHMMMLRWQQFNTQESSRNAGESGRKERFEAGMEQRLWLFEQACAQLDEKMYSALSFVEDGFVQAMKDRIKKLVRTQQQSLEEARERRSIAFTRSQSQRETEMGTQPATISGKIQVVGPGIPPEQPLSDIPRLPTPNTSTPTTICFLSDDHSTTLSGRSRSRSPYRNPLYFPPVAPPEIYQKRSWYTYYPGRLTSVGSIIIQN